MANPVADEESSPLIPQPNPLPTSHPATKPAVQAPPPPPQPAAPPVAPGAPAPCHWTADGLPRGHGSVVGEPVGRVAWNSGLFSCLGTNDEFCSSDLEVCLLGCFAPCVLHGSNVERLEGDPSSFANNCLPYAGLYLLGNSLFGWNTLAPWFSYRTRTAIRRKFNLEGYFFEGFARSCVGCQVVEDDARREHLEAACDFATHYLCHPCSLCQESRELRRRLPHPGFNGRPVLIMMPPMEQSMARGL